MSSSPFLLLFSLIFIFFGWVLIRKLSKRDDGQSQAAGDDTVLEDFVAALQTLKPGAEINYDPETDMIHLGGEDEARIFLGNMRRNVGDMGRSDQRETIRNFLQSALGHNDLDRDAIRSGLGLRPRTADEMALRTVQMGDKYEHIIFESGDLFLDLICDVGPAIQGMVPDNLETADLSRDEAFQLAKGNLRGITPETVDALWEELEPGIWAMRVVDDYSAARLVSLWPNLPLPIKGVGTVFIPTHGTVLLIEGRDTDVQKRLIALGEELQTNQRQFSARFYAPSDDGFVALNETQSERLATTIARFRSYEEQADLLGQKFEQEGEDIFVPRAMVLDGEEAEPGIPRLGTVLINGSTIIPHVDVLVVVDDGQGKQMSEVDWDKAAEILGAERLKPYPGLIPVRYDLRDPIPADVMQRLFDAGTVRTLKGKS